jgi:GntR family transcriptional regulator
MEKKQSLYIRIYHELKEKIETGALRSGDKLPPEYQLQANYQVSRDTIRKSLAKLEQDGYISRRAATGTVVNKKKADYTLTKLTGFSEQMRTRGVEPSSEILSIELLEYDELSVMVRNELELPQISRAYKICRIRKADSVPMAFETTFIPYDLCPDMQIHLNAQASLYDIYKRQYGLQLNHGKISLEAELPPELVQKKLGIDSATPALKMLCTAYLDNAIPLYYVVCYYAGDKYVFTAQLPR